MIVYLALIFGTSEKIKHTHISCVVKYIYTKEYVLSVGKFHVSIPSMTINNKTGHFVEIT